MLRSYRHFIFALVGWLVLSAANQPTENAQSSAGTNQANAAVTAEPPYAAYPDLYAEACYKAKDHEAADLCAQWRAALAAEKAATESRRATTWSIIAAGLSLLTVIGLIVSIWQTFGALGEARRGNLIAQRANARATRQAIANIAETKNAIAIAERQANIAEDTAERQLRAYVSPSVAWLDVSDDGHVVGHVHTKNYGSTPAINERHWISLWVEKFPLRVELTDAPDDFQMGSAVLGPGGHHEMAHSLPNPICENIKAEIREGRVAIYVYGKITYDDIYGEPHESRYIYFCTGKEAFEEGRVGPYMAGNTCE